MNAQLLPTLILVIALGLVLILLFAMCTLIWHKLEQIESVLYVKNIKFDPKIDMLVDLGIEHWRLSNYVKEASDQLNSKSQKKIDSSLNQIKKYLDNNDIRVEDYTGRLASHSINVDIIGTEHDPTIEKPIFKETFLPEVTYKGIIRKKAQVIKLDNLQVKEQKK